MTLFSAGLSAYGKLMAGGAARDMDLLQAQAYGVRADAAKTNAGMLNTQADIAGMGVDFSASKERTALGQIAEAGRSTLAAQRSYFAGGNIDPTFGSPLVVQAVTAGRIATDIDLTKAQFSIDKANALTTEANIRGQASGAASEALTSLINQKSYGLKADADMQAAILGAATSFLTGMEDTAKQVMSVGGG